MVCQFIISIAATLNATLSLKLEIWWKDRYAHSLYILKQAKHVGAAPGEAGARSPAYWPAEGLHCGLTCRIRHSLWWQQGHREGKDIYEAPLALVLLEMLLTE